jgi:hypothetical protein
MNTNNDTPADDVNHPSHYTTHPSGVECIELTRHMPFCIGNAWKYTWRMGLKPYDGLDVLESEIKDLKKAIWYLNDHLKLLEKKRNEAVPTPDPTLFSAPEEAPTPTLIGGDSKWITSNYPNHLPKSAEKK